MMRRRYFSALMFTAVLVFASPAGKTMASQVSENQTQSIAENVNVAVPSEAEKQVSGADDAITTVEEVLRFRRDGWKLCILFTGLSKGCGSGPISA